jgi:acetyl esterase/lipase
MKQAPVLIVCFWVSLLLFSCSKKNAPTMVDTLDAATITNLSYGSDNAQKLDVYLPANRSASSTKVMVLIHGGAWIAGDKSDFASFVDSLKRRLPEYAIVNINYRLSSFPNNLFPTQEMDVKAAISFIDSKRAEWKITNKLVLVGASAGAHLSLLHAYKYSSPIAIKAVVDFFGPTNLTDMYNNPGSVPAFSLAQIIGATPSTNPSIYQQSSPSTFVGPSVCPTIIFQGSNDPLVNPVRQSEALYNQLVAASVPTQYTLYIGKGHGDDWDGSTYFDAFNKIQAFLQLHNP